MKSDNIKLSGKKLKMAEMLANPEFIGTNKELYEAVGISHDTFYRWIKDDEIISYADELIEKSRHIFPLTTIFFNFKI